MQEVFVFGRGKLYREKERYIKSNFAIVGFLDNEKINSELSSAEEAVPVFLPEKIVNQEQEIPIILMSYQYGSMWKQLYDLGVRDQRIIFGITFPPYTEAEDILFQEGRHLAIEGENIVYCYDSGKKLNVENHRQLQVIGKEILREGYREEYPLIQMIAEMDTKPASRKFGLERGKAIDRYYIEHFLEKNRELIFGDCLEIAENTYTLQYGENKVKNSYILHLEGWGEKAIKGNLETGEGIEENRYDCVIITQTLMFIFDIKKVAANIYKMVKRGGSALITVSGISQISRYDADLWGSYYSFHEGAMRALFEPLFGKENVKVNTYGNVKTAMALLYGMCQEDLREEDFKFIDKDYPVILTILAKKR